MRYEINWSNLIIEKGVFDPLGLWRVGDRIIANLLSPFTTVVKHRPARYFSMYCWIFYFLNKKKFENDKFFWKKFYAIESIFLCAIRMHESHNYKYFQGQIGTVTAKKNIEKIKKGITQLTKLEKTNNGWDTNYKNAMYDFFLIETDFGITSKIKLTKRGEAIAKAYQRSIEQSQFYKNPDIDNIDYELVEDLTKYSCPCLIYNPENDSLENESNIILNNMLTLQNLDGYVSVEGLENILSSIYLMLNCLMAMNEISLKFSIIGWRQVLSTGLLKATLTYRVPDRFLPTFKMWELYNLDSILIYALESGLCGFLEFLHKNEKSLKIYEFNLLENGFDIICDELDLIKKHIKDNDIEETLCNFSKLGPEELLQIEENIIEMISIHTGDRRIAYSFFLYLYAQSLYYSKWNNPEYKETYDFYLDQSEVDGWELSLQKTLETISCSPHKTVKSFFLNEYLKKWIVDRQLNTRMARGKDVAWFSYNNETKSYNWEAAYKPDLYRAPRSEILMTFLLNLNIVEYKKGKWAPGSNIKLLDHLI